MFLSSNVPIAINICTWHDSCADVACANFCNDMIHQNQNGVRAKQIFYRIRIVMENALVNWVPSLNELTRWELIMAS